MVFLAGHSISRLEFRRDMSDQDVFPYRTALFKDAQNTVTLGMVYAFSSASQVAHKETDLKHELLYPMTEIICWKDESRFLPSDSDVAVMWASGLGSSQTTPSTSTQAAPAPRVDCSAKARTLNAWLELLTNPVTERFYDC